MSCQSTFCSSQMLSCLLTPPTNFHIISYKTLLWKIVGNIEVFQMIRYRKVSQIAKFMGPTWGPSGPFRPQTGPCWPHETCYQLSFSLFVHHHMDVSSLTCDERGHHYGSWCPVWLTRQVTSNITVDYARSTSPCLPRGSNPIVRFQLVLVNARKRKYMIIIAEINSERERVNKISVC